MQTVNSRISNLRKTIEQGTGIKAINLETQVGYLIDEYLANKVSLRSYVSAEVAGQLHDTVKAHTGITAHTIEVLVKKLTSALARTRNELTQVQAKLTLTQQSHDNIEQLVESQAKESRPSVAVAPEPSRLEVALRIYNHEDCTIEEASERAFMLTAAVRRDEANEKLHELIQSVRNPID